MKKARKLSTKLLAIILSVAIAVVSLPIAAFASDYVNDQDFEQGSEPSLLIQEEPVELVDERTADTKRFRMEDGSFVIAQYDTAVHYLDENGRWQDIDNRLTADGSEISTVNAKIKFAKKTTGNGNLFTLHDGNRKITLSLNGANKKVEGQITNFETEFGEDATKLEKMTTLDRVSASVKYENILANTDLEYVVHGLNIKENIIVKTKCNDYSYSFTVALNNLSAQKTASGEIEIVDSATEEVFYVIPAPIMWDANGVTSYAAEYTLTDLGNGKYDLTVTADPSWMNDSNRVYPVTVDPAIYKSAASDVLDLHVSEVYTGSNDEGSSSIYFGSGSCIYWKLKELPSLPYSAVITNASFQATFNNSTGLQGYIGVYGVLKDWNSDLTYQEMDDAAVQGNDVPGDRASTYTDFAYVQEVSALEPSDDVTYGWNVTPLVRNWYGEANYGLSLAVVSGTSFNGEVLFYASESGNNRPSLTIEYRDQKGLEDYWSYSSQSAGFAGSSSINHANGNLILSIPMVSSVDGLMPFTPTLVYNSAMVNKDLVYQSESDGCYIDIPYTSATMPTGFQLNIQETLVEKSYVDASGATCSFFTWNDSDGTAHYFIMRAGRTNCKDEDGLHLTLETTNSGTTYTITDDNDNVRTFTQMTSPNSAVLGAWYLSSIADKNGNKLAFVGSTTTPHQIASIKLQAANGATVEQLKLAYNSEGRLYAVWNATSDEGVVLRYTASGTARRLTQLLRVHSTGDLTEAKLSTFYSSNSTTSTSGIIVDGVANYTYDTAGQITKVRNELSRYELNYQYENGKVFSVQEKAGLTSSLTNGQKIALNYGTENTTVQTSGTDDIFGSSDDLLTTYLFDYAGRCVNSYTTDINQTKLYGSASGEYVSDNENAKNSLKTVAQTTQRSSNYLFNGGFEYGMTSWSYSSVTADDPGTNAPRSYEGNRYAGFVVGSGTGYISQNAKLDSGAYLLSFYYRYTYEDNIPSKATIKILRSSTVVAQESIPLDKSNGADAYSYISVPFTVPQSSSKISYTVRIELTNTSSENAYLDVDNVMLAKSIGASEFDMIQMGHFESSHASVAPLSRWSGQTSHASVVTSPTDADLFGNVVCLNGGIGTETTISQTVYTATSTMRTAYRNLNPNYYKPGRTVLYNLSGWAKAASGSAYGNDCTFKVCVSVEYYTKTSSATVIQTENWEYDFNREITDWQYFNATIPVYTNYRLVNKITVSLHYENQPNVAYFDELSLVCNSDKSAAYEYNEAGYVISAASGKNETQYSYNDNNDVIRSLTPDGMLTEYTYDAKGRVITERIKYWTGGYYEDSEDRVYKTPPVDDTSSWSSASAKLLTTTTYTYNTLGLLTKTVVTDSTGTKLVTESTYNTSGSLIGLKTEEIDARGQYTYYFYDSTNGRMVAVIYPDETGVCYSYDGMGNLTSVQPASYSAGDYYEQTGASVGYTYDSTNRLSRIQTESTSYTLTYDVFGNTTQIKAGSNTLASYSYNSGNGKLSVLTYGNGLKVKYVYDALDRVKEIRYNTGSGGAYQTVYSYQYTADGQLASIKDHTTNRITVYSYDPSGKMIGSYEYLSTENLSRHHAHYVYDELSRLTNVYQTVNYKVGAIDSAEDEIQVQYFYNSAGRLEQSNYTAGGYYASTTLTYDDLGRMTSKLTSFDCLEQSAYYVDADYTYVTVSSRGTTPLVATYTVTVSDSFGTTISSMTYRYTYDANGNITAIRDGSNAVVAQYTYDSLGQLTQEINAPLNRKFVWTYDDAGNILSKKTYNNSSGALIETQNYTYATGSWGDLLASVGNTEIQYDSIGNPTMWGEQDGDIWYNGAILEWQGRDLQSFQAFNELDGTYMDADYAVYFKYNSEGIRTEKITDAGNHEYILNGSQIVGEWIGNRSKLIVYLYDEMGLPIGMKIRDYTQAEGEFDEYFFEKNLQGDIVAVYNMDGEKIGTYTYDAWGNFTITLASTNTTAENNIVNTYNPYRYRGYYYDVETGLYYLQSRYYNSAWGRFISADKFSKISTTLDLNLCNLYSFSCNDFLLSAVLFTNTGENSITWAQCVESFSKELILHDVPLYDQKKSSLCWAFCQIMVEDYFAGRKRTQTEAFQRAVEVAKSVYGDYDWDRAGYPLNRNVRYSVSEISFDFLVEKLKEGPLYGYYKDLNSPDRAHYVVITGVDVTNKLVFTNNPWGKYGVQTYSEFLRQFVGTKNGYPLYSIYDINQ